MKRNLRTCCLVAIAACFFASAMTADTLRLKNGRTVEGKYLGGTDSEITFYSNGKLEHFSIDQAVWMTFGYQSSSTLVPRAVKPVGSAVASSPQPGAPKTADAAAASTKTAAALGPAQTVLVPAGTVITVRMIDSIDSKKNQIGDPFRATLEEPLVAGGVQIAPVGTMVFGQIEDVSQSGDIKGQSGLSLALNSIRINNMNHPIETGDYDLQGKSRGHQTAERAGIGAVLGGIIGAAAGGGKGAAIGAGIGAGGGAATQVITHGQVLKIPSETVLNFSLAQKVSLPVSTSSAPVR